LDEIGFVWDPHTQKWEEGFAALKKFQGARATAGSHGVTKRVT
jgi:hypothetical protein